MDHHNLIIQLTRLVEVLAGFFLISMVLFDVFETVVVPNLGSRYFRITAFLVRTLLWAIWRRTATIHKDPKDRRDFLALFAPASVLISLLTWINLLLLGFAFVLLAIPDKISPPVHDLVTAYYFAGTAVLTVGFGDIVPVGPAVRIVVLFSAMAGLTIMALVTSLILSLHSVYQRREAQMLRLEGRAGNPPCGLIVLQNHADKKLVLDLENFFAESETWITEILTSHTAYPFLLFFRSVTYGNSWVTSLGAVMDACAIVQTMIKIEVNSSILCYRMGLRVLTEIDTYYRLKVPAHNPDYEKVVFKKLRMLLSAAGYELVPENEAWEKFVKMSEEYRPRLAALAHHLAMPCSTLIPQTQDQFHASMKRLYDTRNLKNLWGEQYPERPHWPPEEKPEGARSDNQPAQAEPEREEAMKDPGDP
jgi:hypothetical protein